MMPRHALRRVKRHLTCECTKPQEWSVRWCYQGLRYMNTQELPLLPPFEANQWFSDDEIKETPLFATPPEWQRKMDRMGFDPTHHDSLNVLQFMKNVEAAKTSIPVGTGVCSLLSRFSAPAQETGRRNTNP